MLGEILRDFTFAERVERGNSLLGRGKKLLTSSSRSPKAICIITPQFVYGGVERWIQWLAMYLDSYRYVVQHLIIRSQNGWSLALADDLPRRVQISFGDADISAITARCDVCLSWGSSDIHRLAPQIRCQHVSVIHGASGCKDQRVVTASMVRSYAQIVGVSGACEVNLPKGYQNMQIIPNGVDIGHVLPSRARDEIRASLGLTGKRVVLAHGRVSAEKRPDLICQAVKLLGDPWFLVLIGFSWDDGQTEKIDFQQDSGNRVLVLPPTNRIGCLLAASDVSVVCSDHESFCYQLVEAWAAGVPSVTTRHAAYHWFTGLHGDLSIPVDVMPEARDLADAIEMAFLAGRDGPLVAKAKAVAMEHYTAGRMASRWMDYLDSILSNS